MNWQKYGLKLFVKRIKVLLDISPNPCIIAAYLGMMWFRLECEDALLHGVVGLRPRKNGPNS